MPWNEVTPMEEINRFVCLAAAGRLTLTELGADFHVSRKTGYKWLRHPKDDMGRTSEARGARLSAL